MNGSTGESKEKIIEDLEKSHAKFADELHKAAEELPPEEEQDKAASVAFSAGAKEGKAESTQTVIKTESAFMRGTMAMLNYIAAIEKSGLEPEELPEEMRKDWEAAKGFIEEMQKSGALHFMTPEEGEAEKSEWHGVKVDPARIQSFTEPPAGWTEEEQAELEKSYMRHQEEELLKRYYTAAQEMENSRPEYDPHDLKSVTDFSSWNNIRAARFQDLHDELQKALEIFRNEDGTEPPELKKAIRKTERKLKDIDAEIKEVWQTLATYQDEQQKEREALEEERKKLEEERRREEIKHTPDLSNIPALSTYGVMNDKINRQYLSIPPTLKAIDGEESLAWLVNQAPEGQPEVITALMLSLGDDEQITTSRKLDAEDDAIITAIANILYKQIEDGTPGPWRVTPDEIWRAKKGIIGQDVTPPPKEKKDLCRRIDRMCVTNVKIDVAQELNKRYFVGSNDLVPDGDGILKGNCIHADFGHAKTKRGRLVDAYTFYAIPIIYSYNQAKGHILLLDYSLLDTSDTTKNDKDNLTDIFKLYLLREIGQMYTGRRKNTKILYSTMYKATGAKTPEERAAEAEHKEGMDPEAVEKSQKVLASINAKADREKIEAILKSWKKRKWILDYDTLKEGRRFIGVRIILNPKNKQATEQKKVTKAD